MEKFSKTSSFGFFLTFLVYNLKMMDHDHVHQSLLDTRPRVKSRLAFKKIKQGTDPQELEIRANQNGKFSLNVA